MGMRIVAAELAVPKHIQSAEELAPLISKSSRWITERTGVVNRHVIDANMESPQLAAEAARRVLTAHPAPDLLIYAGGVPHQAIPDTSVFVARELGFESTPAFSIDATCLSFLVALQIADAMLAQGIYARILICSADLGTRARNMNNPESAALLGDGAAAVLVENITHDSDGNSNGNLPGVLNYLMKTWSSGAKLAEIPGGGTGVALTAATPTPDQNLFHMDGRGLLKFLKPKLESLINECCEQSGISLDDVDLFIPHQTSRAGFRLFNRIGLPEEKTINVLANYGNCVAAGMPMAMATAVANDRVQPGDLVMLIGTSAGVSAAVMLLRW